MIEVLTALPAWAKVILAVIGVLTIAKALTVPIWGPAW